MVSLYDASHHQLITQNILKFSAVEHNKGYYTRNPIWLKDGKKRINFCGDDPRFLFFGHSSVSYTFY